jgi:hypothetical protein
MKTTIRSGYLAQVQTLESAKALNSVTAYFATEQESKDFAATLPKFCKAQAYGLRSCVGFTAPGEYGLVWHKDEARGNSLAYGVTVSKARVSKVTGAANETGDKRISAFIAALSKLEIVAAL